ncbi:MAG: hypothetical protein A2Y38_12780 [Spirochaetes bacterium GWB1_59_5]|nr:MAG: hypothetical protein A2Y38_12780 [Spirochaetes bacterium GWB1_59_5]
MEYVESSNAGEFFMKHVEAMKPTAEQPEGKSFALVKEGFALSVLRDIAESFNVGKQAFVVIEHFEAFEIRRLVNGTNVKLFYKYLDKNEQSAEKASDSMAALREIIEQFKETSFEQISRYKAGITEEMKAACVISYSYVYKRLSNVASIKHSPNSLTDEIKRLIDCAISDKILSNVPETVAKDVYKTSAKIYQILKRG